MPSLTLPIGKRTWGHPTLCFFHARLSSFTSYDSLLSYFVLFIRHIGAEEAEALDKRRKAKQNPDSGFSSFEQATFRLVSAVMHKNYGTTGVSSHQC